MEEAVVVGMRNRQTCKTLKIIGRGGYERNMHELPLDPSYGRFVDSCTAASGFYPNDE